MLESEAHDLSTLFAQLGLPAAEADIEAFVAAHAPLAPAVELADAPFWSKSQSGFLREAIARDSGWAIVVDELDAQLRIESGDSARDD